MRRQFARQNDFQIENVGGHRVYSDYKVRNPATENVYKVALRSNEKQIKNGTNFNFCTCYDFKTNGLGTCKHIEAVIYFVQKNRQLSKAFRETYAPPYSSVYLQYSPGGRQIKIRIGTEERAAYTELASGYFDEENCLKPERYSVFDDFLSDARQLSADFRCYDDAMAFVLEKRAADQRTSWVKRHEKEIRTTLLSKYVKAELHPYQKEGVAFAIQAGRSLIADEMGLGKTLQAIAAAEVLKKEFGIEKVLIVCPTSLKYQWKSEIEKFTDSPAFVIEGQHHKRIHQYFDENSFYKIVSYHTVGNDLEYINKSAPDLIILDEAQRIKNWKAKISQNIKKLKSDYTVVLTGTPLENKLEELYSIVQFIDPFRLGALYRFLNRHQVTEEETNKVIGYRNLNQVGEVLADVLLRRTKKAVLNQLPARQDKNLFVPMTETQMTIHDENYEAVCKLVLRWRRNGFLSEKDRQRLMICMNTMRMVCDSTYILDQETRHDTKIEELMNILEEIFSIPDEKVVIFSQWERMTRLVAKELDDRGIKYENLHGGIPGKDRKDLLTNFQNDPDSRVFLSTDAGGVGLNLQSAAYLINLDIPWNPAVLEQRIARIYRLGQKKKVSIINLVATGTIEHKMLDVLKFKSSMAEGVLDQGDDTILMKEDRFKEFMMSVETVVDTAQKAEAPTNTVSLEEENSPELKEVSKTPTDFAAGKNNQANMGKPSVPGEQLGLFDDDVRPSEPKKREKNTGPYPDSQDTTGHPALQFLNQLSQVLSKPESTQALVSSITEQDSKTGKTYLKLPVDGEDAVKDLLKGLNNLLGAIDWKKLS